ncbi:hypothetical protein [Qipengyuania sp. YIM B01966]|uniref:hypothetical protein n=1 Tax=Qipengyuania sp. YIM B01966 TaxID=2778646 RepID=UPI0018F60C0B|nr:hypothetical protein [Qipengyuania sp. YIM B01966]
MIDLRFHDYVLSEQDGLLPSRQMVRRSSWTMMMAAMMIEAGVGIGIAVLILRMMAAFGPVCGIVLTSLGRLGMNPGPDERRDGEEDEEIAHQRLVRERWRGFTGSSTGMLGASG